MSTRGWRVGGLALTAAAQPRILLLWRVFVLGLWLGFSDFTFSVFSLGFWQDVHLFALSQKKNREVEKCPIYQGLKVDIKWTS